MRPSTTITLSHILFSDMKTLTPEDIRGAAAAKEFHLWYMRAPFRGTTTLTSVPDSEASFSMAWTFSSGARYGRERCSVLPATFISPS